MIQESVEKKKKKSKKSKKDKKIKRVHVEEKPEKKTKFAINWDIQKEAIYKSVKQNYIFYIVLIACLYAFAKDTNSNSNSNSNINNNFMKIFSIFCVSFFKLKDFKIDIAWLD